MPPTRTVMLPNIEKIIQNMHCEMQADTERRWIEQIGTEYGAICYQFNIKLRKPIIAVSDSILSWGTWDSSTRTISLSRDLLTRQSWEHVLGILKHEMAHQYVHDVLGSSVAHGEDFANACRIIGVPPEFRKAKVSLTDTLRNLHKEGAATQENPILRKVEKLLALAQSQNENEAYLAMEKVQELFTKYNLEKARDNGLENYCRLIIDTDKKRIEKTTAMIASILNDHYFVRVVFSSTFHTKTCESTKTVEIMGTRENVLMSEYVFHFLHNAIHSLWLQYQENFGHSIKTRRSYQTGLLTGFREKLEGISHRSPSNSHDEKSLMKIFHHELDSYVQTVFPKLTTRSHGSGAVDSDSFWAGKQDGGSIVIHKGVREQKNETRILT